MNKPINMSPEAITNRMIALGDLWDLTVALRSSKIIDDGPLDVGSSGRSTAGRMETEPGSVRVMRTADADEKTRGA